MNFLITGTKSGFGKYCYEKYAGFSYSRNTSWNDVVDYANNTPNLVIIHAAASAKKDINKDLYGFINDNILLTEKLSKLPHKKFIYLSSVDVYPENQQKIETENIKIEDVKNWYAKSKLISESIVLKNSKDNLILRCSALLGKYMKPNNLIKLISTKNPKLSLTKDSSLNCVTYNELIEFINLAIENKINGIYNIASSNDICLCDVESSFEINDVEYGNFKYISPNISNMKAANVLQSLKQDSISKVKILYKEYFDNI